MAKGSIIFKILIVICILILWQVISIPGTIWSEEEYMEKTSRENINAIFEAENYYYGKNQHYVISDSLTKLIEFISSDSSLQEKRKIGQLTHILDDSIYQVLTIPALKNIIPITQSLSEIQGDLDFNTRYFAKYPEVVQQKDEIKQSLKKFRSNEDFPNFCSTMLYTDSLNILRERINEYALQNSALMAQKYIDSLLVYLPKIELNKVSEYWHSEYNSLFSLVTKIKKETDIDNVTSVSDRLKKFIDRIKTAVSELNIVNLEENRDALIAHNGRIENVHSRFLQGEDFLLTQKNGILQLNEIDSTLIKLNENNFYCPDTFDGKQNYLVQFKEGSRHIVVESPNLLDYFQQDIVKATDPIKNISIFSGIEKVKTFLDSTINLMIAAKTKYRFASYNTELLLSMKELVAEMQDLNNVKFYRYTSNLATFVDTIQTEKSLSVIKPLIEEVLNPIDTLAARITNSDIQDLEAKIQYFDLKVQRLDSLIVETKFPRRFRNQIQPFQENFANIYNILEELKSGFNPDDADKIKTAAKTIEKSLLVALNGYEEPVYAVFFKKHKNHGYIENGEKSWESE